MRLGELIRFTLRTIAFVTNTVGCWVCLELMAFFGRRQRIDVIYCWLARWSRNNLRIYGVHVERSGAGPDGKKLFPAHDSKGVGRIFVMNHRSGMDIPIILTLVEAHIISRHDLATWPFLGVLSRRVGTLFVDRSSQRSGASVLKTVAATLEAGEGVVMFPEGTAHPGDEVHEFRTGAFKSAQRAGAEVVPLGVAYGDEAAYYGKESFLAHLKRIAGLRKLKVAVEIGEPVAVADRSSLEMRDLIHQQVQQLVNQARIRVDAL